MAQIISLLREELNRSLLESGTAGQGGLEVGELGFNADAAALEFSYRLRSSSGFVHVPTSERLAFYLSSTVSGAKIIGYAPAATLAATNIQDALDELAAQVAAGGGGTVAGTFTTGKIPKASGSTTLVDSILSESSSKILFQGDTLANLYRSASGVLKTDGVFSVVGDIAAGAQLVFNGDSLAKLYRSSAGVLNTDGVLIVAGDIAAGAQLVFEGDALTALYRALPGILGVTGDLYLAGGLIADSVNVGNGNFSGLLLALGGADVTGPLTFDGDAVAKFYRSAAGIIKSDGVLNAVGGLQSAWYIQTGLAFRSFGLGDWDDTDTESISMGHNGSSGYLAVDKNGTGTYRDLRFLTSGIERFRIGAAGGSEFSGPLMVDNGLAGQSFTVKSGGTEILGVTNVGTLRLLGSGTSGGNVATLNNSPKAGDPFTWMFVTFIGGSTGWTPVWMP